jgi:hypothetical protein
VDIVVGSGVTNEFGYVITGFDGRLGRPVETKSGPRMIMQLPSFGVDDLPQNLASNPDIYDLEVPGSWWLPRTSFTVVRAEPLTPLERIDFASPPLQDPARLSWTTNTAVQPQVSWASVADESSSQRDVFVSGVLASIAVSIALAVIQPAVTGYRRRPRGRETRANT